MRVRLPFRCGARVSELSAREAVDQPLRELFIRIIFRHRYDDTTNAFKAYRREVIEDPAASLDPLQPHRRDPLKAIIRGHSYRVIPISWTGERRGRQARRSEMGSRYLFIVLYVWLEHHRSRGDYRRREMQEMELGSPTSPAARR